jgi:hypothetical protein
MLVLFERVEVREQAQEPKSKSQALGQFVYYCEAVLVRSTHSCYYGVRSSAPRAALCPPTRGAPSSGGSRDKEICSHCARVTKFVIQTAILRSADLTGARAIRSGASAATSCQTKSEKSHQSPGGAEPGRRGRGGCEPIV